MVYPCFFEKALHGGGHLELKKMHKGDFWGIFGIRLGRCPCIILEKISFLQFYSRFNPNALALLVMHPPDAYMCSSSISQEPLIRIICNFVCSHMVVGIHSFSLHSKDIFPAA